MRRSKRHALNAARRARHLMEAAVALALIAQPPDVHVSHSEASRHGKALALAQGAPVFKDAGIAVEYHVAGAFAKARARVGIARVKAAALLGEQSAAVGMLGRQRIGGAGIENQVRTLHRQMRAGGQRHPQVLAQLYAKDEAVHLKQRIRAEGECQAVARHGFAYARAADEPAGFIEFVAVGQVGLGDKRADDAIGEHRGAVVQTALVAEGQAHHGREPVRMGLKPLERRPGAVLHQTVQKQVAQRIAGQAQLGEYRRLNPPAPEAFQRERNLPLVGLHVAQMNGQADCGNARESFRHNGFLPVSSP